MPLSTGDKLGPYEILAPLGAGGMGEVYRARDTMLDRDVAIKVLPAALAQDPERLARFEREAKVLAALNHPNIAQIYGLEQRALVMELVEGETLKGPLSIEITLNYARQIADALEAAHEKGITHRDLKPANIMITPAGVVKVLDFGLAAVAPDPASGGTDPSNSPTLTMRATQAGMILGTAAYMSPEQASGKPVDKRADIWSFGVVLWEMLTGQQLFTGETVSHVLAAVLTKEPDIERVPAQAQRLLRSCLQKDVKQRLQVIGDWRLLVDDAQGAGPEPAPPTAGRVRVAWAAAAVLALTSIALGMVAWRATRPAELKPLVRLEVDLGADALVAPGGTDAIISPDGTRLVYRSRDRLFTRRLDQPTATELVGTQGATSPFMSPDGQWVAFFASSKLNKISVGGGAVIALCSSAASYTGGSWGEDGSIIAALGANSPLSRISAAGGMPTILTELAAGEATHRWPQILPGGKAVIFTAHTVTGGFDEANVEVMTLADHNRKTLVRGGTFGRYLPTADGSGYLIYVNRGTLFAEVFDLDSLEIRGTPSPVLDQVMYSPQFGSAQVSFSGAAGGPGTLLYRNGGTSGGMFTVQWVDQTGKVEPLLAKPGIYFLPSLSPDGGRLVMQILDRTGWDIWVYDIARDTTTRLTFGGGNVVPIWTPDGRYIVYQDAAGISWTRADGAGNSQPLMRSKSQPVPWSFTPDGRRLAYSEVGRFNDLWTVPIETEPNGLRAGKPEAFLQTQYNERNPSFSPDGRWLAYSSSESGTFQVYVRSFPDRGGKWQVSIDGGTSPVWARNGRELFFETLDDRIMAVTYGAGGGSFVAEKPRVWYGQRLDALVNATKKYDLAPDGKRIAVLMPGGEQSAAEQAQTHVVFLMNFFDELQRKVPVGK